MTNELDKYLIKSELEEYIALINSNKYSNLTGFLNSFKTNLIYITAIAVCTIFFVFSPLILFINFYKGFLAGFMVSSLVLSYKVNGIIYGLIFLFPHEIINIIATGIFSVISINYSYKLIKSIYKNESINTRYFIKKYGLTYIVFLGILIISSLLEVYLNGFLIRIVL